jgi:nucleoside transporter
MERCELMALLFLHGMALAAWFVPMGSVLEGAGLRSLTPFAFAASAIAALMSPLFFGAMADRSVPPLRVLRWISFGTAILASIVALAIATGWNRWWILLGIQLQSLLSVPTNSLTGSIVFAKIANSHHRFGAIRAMGTVGWMAGCWLVSGLHLDASPNVFLLSAGLWVVLSIFTWCIPNGTIQPPGTTRMTLRERFGLDALSLLKIHDHRVIFLTAALLAIPLAAFYPYTPAHMTDLGLKRTSAWMSLGQATEVAAMFCIGSILARWPLRWIIMVGLICALVRYGLYAIDTTTALLMGVGLHGLAYTFTYISTQIYLAKKIDPAWRTRAQALLSMMTGGFGNLAGYLFTGAWLALCETQGDVDWTQYWLVLNGLVLLVLVYFAISYRDKSILK